MIPSPIEFSPRPDLLRRTIERRKPWIESKLGVSLAECVLLEVSIDLAQIALERELNLTAPQASEVSAFELPDATIVAGLRASIRVTLRAQLQLIIGDAHCYQTA